MSIPLKRSPLRVEGVVESKRHLLEDLDAHSRVVHRANEVARVNNLVRIPAGIFDGAVVSLAKYQTGFRDQGSRGTCYAFASCAAIEAAYKRKYGVELDLSEQFAFHLNKAGELYPDYVTNAASHENNSSYWGFQGCPDLIDKLARAAIPDESGAPYLDGPAMDQLKAATPAAGGLDWNSSQEQLDAFEFHPQHVPIGARRAARYRVTNFAALAGNPTPDQVEAVIAGGHEVVADVPGHCWLIVGFDRNRRMYTIKNSWGEGQFIEVSYDDPTWPVLGGRYVIDVAAVDAPPQAEANWIGRWNMDHDGWRGELVIRRTTDFRSNQGNPTKLGTYYRDGQRRDVNGVTIQGGQGLHFWIADGTQRILPGSPSGQEFTAYFFSWDPANAAGRTTWKGIPFGVSLSRDALPGTNTQGFIADDWVGTWAMNHDGWRGTLEITAAQPLSAVYHSGDGRALDVTGSVGEHPHLLSITIPFAPDNIQKFQLMAHTWEKDVFSGLTQWAGFNFGVQGRRQ